MGECATAGTGAGRPDGPGGVERGLGGLTAHSSWKIRQNGGWEARRLDLASLFTPLLLHV